MKHELKSCGNEKILVDQWQPAIFDTREAIVQAIRYAALPDPVGAHSLLDIWIMHDTDIFLKPADTTQGDEKRSIKHEFLSVYLARAASAITIKYGVYGKPLLDRPGVDFNLSHTDACHGMAITTLGTIGVDVENIERKISNPISQWLLPRNASCDISIPGVLVERRHIIAWTLNEAFLKAKGWGLRNRNIAKFASCYRQLTISRCGHYHFTCMEWRRWFFMSVICTLDSVVVTLALRKTAAPGFSKEQIRLFWCRTQ